MSTLSSACCFVFQLVTLAEDKTSLLDLWEERRILYEQCMDLQLFYRDTEQADAWMSKQEVIFFIFFILFCIDIAQFHYIESDTSR